MQVKEMELKEKMKTLEWIRSDKEKEERILHPV